MIIGDRIPNICAIEHDGKEICLDAITSNWILLQFYPKDLTPCCKREKLALRAKIEHLASLGVQSFAVYNGDPSRHSAMVGEYGTKLTMLVDEKYTIGRACNVTQKKSYKGREYESVTRMGMLLDSKHRLAAIFKPFQLEFDAMQVVDFIRNVKGSEKE